MDGTGIRGELQKVPDILGESGGLGRATVFVKMHWEFWRASGNPGEPSQRVGRSAALLLVRARQRSHKGRC
eukprot:4083394-Alexandrium_andersonii.AAC.1